MPTISNVTDDPSSNNSSIKVISPSPFSIRLLFFIWLRIGFTSFGGGAVTQYLIQENFIHKHKWITAEEYSRLLAMSQITPGIGIIACAMLVGKKLGGWVGLGISVLGLVVPSAAITIAITAIYFNISHFPRVQASLRAVFAAIFGISLATNWRNVRPILISNRQRGPLALVVAFGIMIGCAIMHLLFHPPIIVLYLLGGLCGAFSYWLFDKKSRRANR